MRRFPPLSALLVAGAAVLAVLGSPLAAQTCQPEFASSVVSSWQGPNHESTPPGNALGDTPTTYFSLGSGGNITVAFSNEFTTSGSSAADLYVQESGDNDCYWICLLPANASTANALANAGLTQFGALYQLPQLFCGTNSIDVDAFVPGYAMGQLRFTQLMVEDDGSSGNGAEIKRLKAELVCPPPPPPPSIPGCAAVYADSVVSHTNGANQTGTSPTNAVGDTPATYHNLGSGGQITLGFAEAFTTSGDGAADLFVEEWGDPDCYWICLVPADAATANALQAAGITPFGNLYQLPMVFCGTVSIDIDFYVPGHANGELRFTQVMVEDDGSSGNGAEVVRVRAELVCAPPPPPPTGCVSAYASSVIASQTGANAAGTPPTNALGDTPSTWFSLGSGGSITVGFDQAFSTSGDAQPDLVVTEDGNPDCYWICLVPADAFTVAALQAAGVTQFGSLFQLPQLFCGTAAIDIDAFVPGHAQGDLLFTQVMVEDDGGGNGAEIVTIHVDYVCPPGPTPVYTCGPEFASSVVSYQPGPNAQATNPAEALGGDTSGYASLGSGGCLALAFSDLFSTTGDAGADLHVAEFGVSDCYSILLLPGNALTAAALQNAGLVETNGYYELPASYCGTSDVDVDLHVPGHMTADLLFAAVKVQDDGSSGDGAEIVKVRANLVCFPECEPGYATTVLGTTPGASQGGNPSQALGDTPSTAFTLGDGGCLAVAFANVFTTDGGGASDLFVDEMGSATECYRVRLIPADLATRNALQAAGLAAFGMAFELPPLLCNDANVDVDAFVPGFASDQLRFRGAMICDEGNGGNGADIARVRAELVCNFVGCLGDRVFVDADCDGVQDGNELDVGGVTMSLYDATGTTLVDQTTTDSQGRYKFYVTPGSYVVGVGHDPATFFVTAAGQGGDPALDSDFDPSTAKTPAITVAIGEQRTDVDAGLCVVCAGPAAFVIDNLPACGSPLDPVLTATVPYLGSQWTLTLDSQMPGAVFFMFISLGPPAFLPVPGSSCVVYLDIPTVALLAEGTLDANGDWSLSLPLPPLVALAGFEATLQARVCEPSIPGPIPNFPDFPSNGLHLRVGCP